VSFELCNLTEETDLKKLLNNETGYYYFVPCAGQSIAEKISQEAEVLEEKEFSYRGWKVNRIKFAAN